MEAAIEELAQSGDELPDIVTHLPGCLSSRTIEGYRASIMRKVGARNAAELLHRVLSQRRTA
jgi:DNA-binding NarL/FixJ family response regulator